MQIDASIAASLLLMVLGTKFAIDALRLLRSKELLANEERLVFYEKFSPITKADSRRFIFGIGLCTYALAWVQYGEVYDKPFTGRLAWLYSLVYQNLGSNGMVLLWVSLGTMLLFSAANPPRR